MVQILGEGMNKWWQHQTKDITNIEKILFVLIILIIFIICIGRVGSISCQNKTNYSWELDI